MLIREAAVAGSFYPADPDQLESTIDSFLAPEQAEAEEGDCQSSLLPKALIVPHAGYIYSGSTAASGYRLLAQHRHQIDKVVLLGPAHRVPFQGIALPESKYFLTPLGQVVVDPDAWDTLSQMPFVSQWEVPHQMEHSLEVQLPFLQKLLPSFSIIPLVVGDASEDQVMEILQHYLGKPGVLVIVSTDLSHFLGYQQAKDKDQQTSQLIEQKYFHIKGDQACGSRPLNGLLKLASKENFSVQRLAICNSGDTAGDRSSVVGYGSYAVY